MASLSSTALVAQCATVAIEDKDLLDDDDIFINYDENDREEKVDRDDDDIFINYDGKDRDLSVLVEANSSNSGGK
jgi:hypothetical protein